MNTPATQPRADDDHVDLTTHVTTAPPTQVGSSVFNWSGSGTSTADDAAHEPTTDTPEEGDAPTRDREEKPMATRKRKTAARERASSNGSPQLALCQALLQHGDLGRDELSEQLPDITDRQFASALNNAKSKGRIVWLEKGQVFHLTKAGNEWASSAGTAGEESPAPQRKPRAKKTGTTHRRRKATRTKPQAEEEVDTSPTDPSFRCAVMSDGAFFISKGDAVIELDADEHRRC